MFRRTKRKLEGADESQSVESEPMRGIQDPEPAVTGPAGRARFLNQFRASSIARFRGLARTTGLPEPVGDLMAGAVDDFGRTAIRSRSVRGARQAAGAVAVSALDRMARLCTRELVRIEDNLERARKGVGSAEGLFQLWLATTSTAAAAPTETMSLWAGLGVDLLLGQVVSLVLGLSEWFAVGTYAAWLLRQEGVEPNPRALRLIVDGAMLTRGGKAISLDDVRPRAESRLMIRWFLYGVRDAVPGLSIFGGRSVRHTARSLERSDLVALAASVGSGSRFR